MVQREDHKLNQAGMALLAITIVLPFLVLITALYLELTVSSVKLARRDQMYTHAQLAADAGVDEAMRQINQSSSWSGTGGEQENLPVTNGVRTTYSITIANPGSDQKIVTSTGRVYQLNVSAPTAIVKVEASLRSVSSGEYSVVGGVGGLIMDNSSKILGGDVHINGAISMKNSAQIGLSTNPVNLTVAHQNCPPGSNPGATYPRICGSGENGQPISLTNSAHIYGNVRANNQTNGADMSNPGLTASAGVAAEPLPVHDRNALKTTINNADAANSPDAISGSSAGCSSGTKAWAANQKINGDVSISNSCKVTVNGDVWITGKLEVKNSAELIVSNSLGTTKPVIMVDGDDAKFSNSAKLKSNASSTGFYVITYKSNTGCSPNCSNVTGSDLYNSRNQLTIELDNSASGPNTIFYARWSLVKVKNSGSIGALVGQTIDLSNSGVITFGTSTGTGTSFWIINSIRRVF